MEREKLFQKGLDELEKAGNGWGNQDSATYFRMAANLGHVKAMYYLGLYCEHQTADLCSSEPQAVKWLEKAAALGDVDAQYQLGWYYERNPMRLLLQEGKDAYRNMAANPDDAVPIVTYRADMQEYKYKAEKWYRLAAGRGHRDAQFRMGLLRERGIGPAFAGRDIPEAFQWYQRAAAQGQPHAQCRLGHFYLYGNDAVQRDLTKAAGWYQKAAAQGVEEARARLGLCYDLGVGVKKDAERAAAYYRSLGPHYQNKIRLVYQKMKEQVKQGGKLDGKQAGKTAGF